jgi:LysM repeat protein
MKKKRILIIGSAIILVMALLIAIRYYSSIPIYPSTTEYIVKAGDTCGKISSDQNIPVETLIQQNNLKADCSNLTIGQKLIIHIQK